MTTPTTPTTISPEAREAAQNELREDILRHSDSVEVQFNGQELGHFVQQLLDDKTQDLRGHIKLVEQQLATQRQQLSSLRVIARQFSVNIPHSVNRTACQNKALQDYNQWLTLNPETKNV